MVMTNRHRVQFLQNLHDKITEELQMNPDVIDKAQSINPWFTSQFTKLALSGIAFMLRENQGAKWINSYTNSPGTVKTIGLVLAGNIPLVGFHDILCVLMSGHKALIKTSREDDFLIKLIMDWVTQVEPGLSDSFSFTDRMKDFDAVIATGSDNTARYFDYYFGKYPNIIRKNRTSIAIIDKEITQQDFVLLAGDVFEYFGLGCRNVSKLFIHEDVDIKMMLDQWMSWQWLADHHKYRNNYEYQKSILLVNNESHLDTGFTLLKQTSELVAPISLVFYDRFRDFSEVVKYTTEYGQKLQCIVGKTREVCNVPFGQAQKPELWDYADNVDTMQFLQEL
jgi:hypothetical protein